MTNYLKLFLFASVLALFALGNGAGAASLRPAELESDYESARVVSATISGKVTLISNTIAIPLEGVEIKLSQLVDGIYTLIATTYTDENGEYEFAIDQAARYMLKPGLAGYTFDPSSQKVIIRQSGLYQADFNATERDR